MSSQAPATAIRASWCRRRLALRRALAVAGFAVVALAAAAPGALAWGGYDGGVTATPFSVPLNIPPVAQPNSQDATTDYYNVYAEAGWGQIIPGLTTRFWGYRTDVTVPASSGPSFPGPTIEAKPGRRVSVHFTNRLGESLSMHLHGGHQQSASDGLPSDLVNPFGSTVAPFGEKTYVYPDPTRGIFETPRTMWYHDHARDVTAQHVWQGLAGFYLVKDYAAEAAAHLNLPTGSYDVPLMILNRAFSTNGTMPYQDGSGDQLLVNGSPQPYFQVEPRKYRFRMLNASNDDFYSLALSNSQAMVQVGNEGGLLAAPVSRTTISLAPAERADVVIDFSKIPMGTSVRLTGANSWRTGGDVMRFDVVKPLNGTDTGPIATTLRTIAPLSTTGAVTRTFTLDRGYNGAKWTINGHGYDPNVYDATPKLGSTEVWTFQNNTGEDHPIHVHDVNFQVLSVNGKAPSATDRNAGWKETVNVTGRSTVKVAAKFDDYTGTYVLHCHRLEHEDNMMMTQFKVVP